MPGFDRVDRQAEELRRGLDSVLRNQVKDPRIPEMFSITNVELTRDLKYAKVYVSVLDKGDVHEVVKGLKSAAGYLRRELGRALQLRYTPELTFTPDDSIAEGARILEIIHDLEK